MDCTINHKTPPGGKYPESKEGWLAFWNTFDQKRLQATIDDWRDYLKKAIANECKECQWISRLYLDIYTPKAWKLGVV